VFEVKVVNRKYAQAVLTTLRDKNTSQIEFRKGLVRLGRILGLEIIEDFDCEKVVVETPLGVSTYGCRIRDLDNIIVITVLRAAWPLTEGLIKVLYTAKQGVVAARRVEEKGMREGGFEIEVSYIKTPRITGDDVVVISDVMVATGSTLIAVLDKLREKGVAKRYYIASVITTPHAIGRLKKYSDENRVNLKLYTIAVDPEVNDKGYIVPGLGDAGDRAFGS